MDGGVGGLSVEWPKDSLSITIPTADIPMGVCQLVVFEPWGEQVKMELSLTGTEGEPLRDRFCLSVRDGNNIKTACVDNLATSMLLSSDLRGHTLRLNSTTTHTAPFST